MSEEKKVSRRVFMGTIAGAAVAAGVAGYVGGFLTAPREVVTPAPAAPPGVATPPPIQEAAPTVTVTETAPPVTVTETVTAPEVLEPIKVGAGNAETGPFATDGLHGSSSQILALEEQEAIWGGYGRPPRKWQFINVDAPNKNTEDATAAIRRLVTRENVDMIITDYITIDATEYEESKKYDVFYFNQDTTKLAEEKVLKAGWSPFFWQSDVAPFSGQGWNMIPPEGIQVPPGADITAGDNVPPYPQFDYWQSFVNDGQDIDYSKNIFQWMMSLIDRGVWKPRAFKFASVAGDNAYSFRIGKVWVELMKWAGWTPVLDEVIVGGVAVEWGPILTKLRQDPPDIVFVTHFVPRDQAAFMTQFREDPFPAIVYFQYGASVPEFLELTREIAFGACWHECMGQLHDEIGLDFRERFENRWGFRPAMANTGVQYDAQWVGMRLWLMAGGTKGPAARRVSAIMNSGVSHQRADFLNRGTSGVYRCIPGQVGAYWQCNEPTLESMIGIPELTYQVQPREGQHKYGTRRPGNVPTHVIIGPHRPTKFWHHDDVKANLPIKDDGIPYYSVISKTLMEISPRFYISDQYPWTTTLPPPSYADTDFWIPDYFAEVRPAIQRRMDKY